MTRLNLTRKLNSNCSVCASYQLYASSTAAPLEQRGEGTRAWGLRGAHQTPHTQHAMVLRSEGTVFSLGWSGSGMTHPSLLAEGRRRVPEIACEQAQAGGALTQLLHPQCCSVGLAGVCGS